MSRTPFLLFLPFLAALAGCATPPAETRPPAEVGIERALFAEYPTEVYEGLAGACDKPGDHLERPSRGRLLCEGLPDPTTAAQLIVSFDGRIDDLPRFVLMLTGQRADGGYLVTFDYHIRVPQAAGTEQIVRVADARLTEVLRTSIRNSGGQVLAVPAS